jgi:hypothetical protein
MKTLTKNNKIPLWYYLYPPKLGEELAKKDAEIEAKEISEKQKKVNESVAHKKGNKNK